MLTSFGRYLRKLRIDRGESMRHMADKLQVTASYLSAVETGKRNIPSAWLAKIAMLYSLDAPQQAEMETAAAESATILKINIAQLSPCQRKTATLFAYMLDRLDERATSDITSILTQTTC